MAVIAVEHSLLEALSKLLPSKLLEHHPVQSIPTGRTSITRADLLESVFTASNYVSASQLQLHPSYNQFGKR